MSDTHASTRLGDLLVEKGKISQEQLYAAIRCQQDRRLAEVQQGLPPSAKNELGKILVELGYISRYQLKYSLGWQRRLRKAAALAITFVAPLLTAACGGGGSGAAGNATAGVKPISSHSSSANNNSGSLTSSSLASSSSRSSVAKTGVIDGPVLINWTAPTHREDGEYLDIAEVGGYELRYKLKTESEFTRLKIMNGYTDSYYFPHLQGIYDFEIAAFDSNGVYSDFVAIQ